MSQEDIAELVADYQYGDRNLKRQLQQAIARRVASRPGEHFPLREQNFHHDTKFASTQKTHHSLSSRHLSLPTNTHHSPGNIPNWYHCHMQPTLTASHDPPSSSHLNSSASQSLCTSLVSWRNISLWDVNLIESRNAHVDDLVNDFPNIGSKLTGLNREERIVKKVGRMNQPCNVHGNDKLALHVANKVCRTSGIVHLISVNDQHSTWFNSRLKRSSRRWWCSSLMPLPAHIFVFGYQFEHVVRCLELRLFNDK